MGAWVLAAGLLLSVSVSAVAEPAKTVPQILDEVRVIHGAAGPWAVAGYRMGQRILKELGGLPRHSFALRIEHASPAQVQYSCVLDGLQAATGASLGKLNLAFRPVPADRMSTYAVNRKTGKRIRLRIRPELAKSIWNVPYDKAQAAAERVAALEDDEIFTLQ